MQSPCRQPVTSGRRPSVQGGRAGSRSVASRGSRHPRAEGSVAAGQGLVVRFARLRSRQRRRRLHALEGPVGRAGRVRGPPAPGAVAGAACGGVPHCVLLTCRGRSAHLVPEEKMVPKALRVVEGRTATPAPWGPLGRRYVAQRTTACGQASFPVASGIVAGHSVGPKPPEGAVWPTSPPPRHSRRPQQICMSTDPPFWSRLCSVRALCHPGRVPPPGTHRAWGLLLASACTYFWGCGGALHEQLC